MRARIPPALPGRAWTSLQIAQYLAGRMATHRQVARHGSSFEIAAGEAADELVLWELFRLGYSLSRVAQAVAKVHMKHGSVSLAHLRRLCVHLEWIRARDLYLGLSKSIGACQFSPSWFAGTGRWVPPSPLITD